MKILFISACYLPTVNGVSHHIQILKQELERKSHQVMIMAPYYKGYRDSDANIYRYPSLYNPIIRNYPIGLPFIDYDIALKFNPDVIHMHHPFITGIVGKNIQKIIHKPLFFTFHTKYENYADIYAPFISGISRQIIRQHLIGLSSHCRKIICPSKNIYYYLKDLNIENIVYIPNGIETDFFRPGKTAFGRKLKIIYIGRIQKEKNLEFFIKLLPEISGLYENFSLTIIGSGNYKKELVSNIQEIGFLDKIIFKEEQNRKDLRDYYQKSDIFFTPSLSEVMPLTVIESLSCGVPVIGLKNSNLDELIINSQTGYILEKNHKQVAQKMVFLKKNPKLMAQMKKRSRSHAEGFSIGSTARQLIEIYRN